MSLGLHSTSYGLLILTLLPCAIFAIKSLMSHEASSNSSTVNSIHHEGLDTDTEEVVSTIDIYEFLSFSVEVTPRTMEIISSIIMLTGLALAVAGLGMNHLAGTD